MDVYDILAKVFPYDDEFVILTNDLDIVQVEPSFGAGHQDVEYFWMPSHGDCFNLCDIKRIMPKSWMVDPKSDEALKDFERFKDVVNAP